MALDEERQALIDVAALLSLDLRDADKDTLIQAAQDVELLIETRLLATSGVLLAMLHEHLGMSWPQIARATGVSQTTAFRRAKPFKGLPRIT